MSSDAAHQMEYVLGTGLDELARLGLQHRLWSDATCEAWKRAGFALGSRVLDVGCGPGHASMDLGQLVGPEGRVVGVDESAAFIEHLNEQARVRGLGQVSGAVGDVQRLGDVAEVRRDSGGFDGAYARWVLCFVAEPSRVIEGVAGALKRGGVFVVHDYFNYTSMTAGPRETWHDALVSATAASWRTRGGDPDVCARLPRLFDEAGMEVIDLRVHQRIARGGEDHFGRRDPMLAWITSWWRTFAPKLAAMGLITSDQHRAAMEGLAKAERDPHVFFVCPPVFEVVGRKR